VNAILGDLYINEISFYNELLVFKGLGVFSILWGLWHLKLHLFCLLLLVFCIT